ncbi:MAG: citrate (Si)-synthase, partial [Nitrospinota bacterium]|nr:citrate (Si)-synthase [Nitrospinota bacterium]
MGKDTVTITDNSTGKSAEFPIRKGTHGPNVIDVTNLYKKMGMFTYD